MDHVECIVAGAGVVGLAIARKLAREGRGVLVIEAAAGLGAGTSGRGSGVIHAGLYYPPGSLKARLCVAGRDALYAYAKAHGVLHRRVGKLVVATSEAERATLENIRATATASGVVDLAMLEAAEASALEPELRCTAALLSPSTGVIDVPGLLQALRDEAETNGAVLAFSAPLIAARRQAAGFHVQVGGAAPMLIGCRLLINAAGHGAPELARAIEGFPADRVPQAYLAKGSYFALTGPAPFKRLIYPVPVAGGVGTHLTVDIAGTARFGPDVEWVERLDYEVDPSRAKSFYVAIRRWWPGLPDGALTPSHSGIRPKIAPRDALSSDFRIDGEREHGVAGLVNLFGIESPGLTAALAIGDHVVGLLESGDAPHRSPDKFRAPMS